MEDSVPHADFPLGIEFGIQSLRAGERLLDTSRHETVWVVLQGEVTVESGDLHATVQRKSLFDEPPSAPNLSADTALSLRAGAAGCELAVARTPNATAFHPRLYRPEDLQPEYRGAGLVQNACLRNVRLIFDRANRPESNFVLGEVVNYPGRWSSYPPHHHAQVSAPGYGMYYLWLIRHLPGNPYTGFTFTPEHQWTLDAAQQGWRPQDLPPGLV